MLDPILPRPGCERLTAPGPAAICALRLTGTPVGDFLARHVRRWADRPDVSSDWIPGSILRAALLDPAGNELDDLLISVVRGPPEWDVRLFLHGSTFLLEACESWAAQAGLPGRTPASPWCVDSLIEEEALELLPGMLTDAGVNWLLRSAQGLLDFVTRCRACGVAALSLGGAAPKDLTAAAERIARQPVRVEWFLKPLRIGLLGPPNAGKSTLMNALTDQPVSLTSPRPGTTRDWVEAAGEVSGYPVVWVDTAGLHRAADPLESAGILSTIALLAELDLIVLVLDGTRGQPAAIVRELLQTHAERCVLALNKRDLPDWSADATSVVGNIPWVSISAEKRLGLEELGALILARVHRDDPQSYISGAFTNRQRRLLGQLASALTIAEFNLAAEELYSYRM